MLDGADRPCYRDVNPTEGLDGFLIVDGMPIETKQCDVIGIGAEESGLARRVCAMAYNPDPLIRGLIAVADRAVAYRTLGYGLVKTFEVRGFVDNAGREQHKLRLISPPPYIAVNPPRSLSKSVMRALICLTP